VTPNADVTVFGQFVILAGLVITALTQISLAFIRVAVVVPSVRRYSEPLTAAEIATDTIGGWTAVATAA